MLRKILILFLTICFSVQLFAQDATNLTNLSLATPNSGAASKAGSVPVNIYTGVPIISVPIYSFGNNSGIGFDISLGYNAGGIQVNESPSIAGLGWFLNATAAVTRTVRGAPDDMPSSGYLNSAAIPADYRSNGDKYYFDTLDTQQDIFQFNCNGRSGKFVISKTGQIILIPDSKVSITYATGSYNGVDGNPTTGITSFKIKAEDGTKYIFSSLEKTIIKNDVAVNFRSNYANQNYISAWYLSSVISPFNTDTIYFYYTPRTKTANFPYPQTAFYKVSDGSEAKKYTPFGTNTSATLRLDSILFPQKKKIKFAYTVRTSDNDIYLNTVKISDTVFRFGYLFEYDAAKKMLVGITPFTNYEKGRGYQFTYYDFVPVYIAPNDPNPAITQATRNQNARDHWGYYNGYDNLNKQIPAINGGTGANRSPNATYAICNSLKYMYLPGGGYVYYEYELNDRLPYIKSNQTVNITNSGNTYTTSNNITLTDIISSQRNITLTLANSVSRLGTSPLSGSLNLTCKVVNASNTSIVYSTYTFSLYDIFYTGLKTWSFNLADGNYILQTSLAGTGTITGSFPITISWENKTTDNSKNAETVGGLRIKKTTKRNATDDPNGVVTEYKYVKEDGKSSGFLGDIPKYDYAYRDTVKNGTTVTTAYNAVSSEPLGTMNYTQGSPVGYSRVEVYNGTSAQNMGKVVYEFTNLQDAASNFSTPSFPYAPTDVREWGLGLPEKVSVYDSSGLLLKRTTNEYSYINTSYSSSDYKNIKLGWDVTTYNGPSSSASTPRTRGYVAQEFYPSSGRVSLSKTIDTIYNYDGSKSISYQTYTYNSTYYNVSKVTTKFDSTRGLYLESRIYYPYDYTLTGAIGKLRDSSIITIPVSSEKWITGDGNDRISDASISDFQTLANGSVVPSNVYKFQSNKPIAQATIGTFNAASLVRNTTYFIQQSSVSLYDAYSNPLQVNNVVTNQSASVIMDYSNQYAIAKISNAAYADVAYTSFESDGTGNWTITGTARDYTASLTGKLSYNLSNGNITKSGLTSATTYLITVWGKSGATVNINGSSAGTSIASQNGWNLYSKTVTGVTTVTISGSGLIDELRLHPKDANMITTAYEPNIGPISICDANNTVLYNEYDNMNRLKLVRDKDKNILKKMEYTDSAMLFSGLPNSTAPDWQPYFQGNPSSAISCKKTGGVNNGTYDSVYIDKNPYSDSFNLTKNIYVGTNHCACPVPTDPPSYKIVNGVCEEGIRYNNSTNYQKDLINGVWVWHWKCDYYYFWSDGSRTDADSQTSGYQDYYEYNSSACPLGVYNP